MNIHKFYTRNTIVLWVVFLILASVGIFYLFNNFIYQEKQTDNTHIEPYRAELSGEYVCLPSKDTTSRQVDECVFGLKTDTGEYYGINFFLMSQTHDPILVGERISAHGVVHPVDRLGADHWHNYPIEGMFSVTNSLTTLDKEAIHHATMVLGDTTMVMDVVISPQEIISDSRCPVDVQCIWDGTVEVRTILSTQVSHGEHVFTLGEPQVFGDYMVTLIGVSPGKTQETVSDDNYHFTYKVTR